MKCLNCGSEHLQKRFDAPLFDYPEQLSPLNACLDCGMVVSSPIPEEELAGAYDSTYYGSADKKFSGLIEDLISRLQQRQAENIIQCWTERAGSSRSPKVLDIGCGRGVLLKAFQAAGAEAIGMEREGFDVPHDLQDVVFTGNLDQAQFADGQFDIIVLWHVLEHIENIEDLLARINRHLKTDGMLVLAVPNFESLQAKLFRGNWFHLDLPRHRVHIEASWLIKKLSDDGYHIAKVSHIDFTQNIYGFIQSALNVLRPKSGNQLYKLLRRGSNGSWVTLALWLIPAGLLAPLALLELMIASLMKRGATISVFAVKEKS